MTAIKIPVASPDLSGKEEHYVVDALRSTWISSTGPYVTRFEQEFASICGTRTALAVCNGTVALHLALLTLDVRPGDEVLVPALTYVATANAVRYVGAVPVFVDVDPMTWCLDPSQIERHITPRTRGIIPVHLYGHPADMDSINAIAAVHGLWVIEDAAEAPMATYKGKPVGQFSRIATFSFYGNKVFTSGEGGAVVMDDQQLEVRARILRGQGMDPNRRYYFPVTGYNFRLTNIACAMLCAQLERKNTILARRLEIFHRYESQLAQNTFIGRQPIAPWATLSPWLYCITIEGGRRARDEVAIALQEKGIETRPFFIPLPKLPPFREVAQNQVVHNFPVSERLGATGLNLPTYVAMKDSDVDYVCESLLSCVR